MILAIDTSSAVSVALVSRGEPAASASEYAPRGHAELLGPMIRTVLNDADASSADVESVVVGTGPAPFTGLRVGLVTARVFARARGIAVRGCCSLDALGAAHGGDVTVVADARRKEVFWARYSAGACLEGPFVSSPAEVPLNGAVVGRGATVYPEFFGRRAPDALDPDPAWLVRIVEARLGDGEDDFPVVPLYLRRPDVHGVRQS